MKVKVFNSDTWYEENINAFLAELKKDGLVSYIVSSGDRLFIFYDSFIDDSFPGVLQKEFSGQTSTATGAFGAPPAPTVCSGTDNVKVPGEMASFTGEQEE
jgi:hypothetical protein